MNSLILCKLPILFSKVKLKLGHNLSQFIHRFKIEIFLLLVLGCTSKNFPILKKKLRFLNVALSGILFFFFSIHEKDGEWAFLVQALICCTSQFTKFFPIR